MDGLRTLVLCTRDLTVQEFNAWKAAHHNAAIAIGKKLALKKYDEFVLMMDRIPKIGFSSTRF